MNTDYSNEDYKHIRAHAIAMILALEYSGFIEKLNNKDSDTLIDMLVAVYDTGYIHGQPTPDYITVKYPNMNNKNNTEV